MISKLGMDSLPVGRGEVRPVELPSVDDRTQVPKEHDSDMKEAGTVQGADTDDRTRHPETGHLGARVVDKKKNIKEEAPFREP